MASIDRMVDDPLYAELKFELHMSDATPKFTRFRGKSGGRCPY